MVLGSNVGIHVPFAAVKRISDERLSPASGDMTEISALVSIMNYLPVRASCTIRRIERGTAERPDVSTVEISFPPGRNTARDSFGPSSHTSDGKSTNRAVRVEEHLRPFSPTLTRPMAGGLPSVDR